MGKLIPANTPEDSSIPCDLSSSIDISAPGINQDLLINARIVGGGSAGFSLSASDANLIIPALRGVATAAKSQSGHLYAMCRDQSVLITAMALSEPSTSSDVIMSLTLSRSAANILADRIESKIAMLPTLIGLDNHVDPDDMPGA